MISVNQRTSHFFISLSHRSSYREQIGLTIKGKGSKIRIQTTSLSNVLDELEYYYRENTTIATSIRFTDRVKIRAILQDLIERIIPLLKLEEN